VTGVLRRTVVCDWRFDNLCGCHLQSQVIVFVSWKFKNPGEQFDWSIDRVAIGKYVMWLAVKTSAEIGYENSWVVKWIQCVIVSCWNLSNDYWNNLIAKTSNSHIPISSSHLLLHLSQNEESKYIVATGFCKHWPHPTPHSFSFSF